MKYRIKETESQVYAGKMCYRLQYRHDFVPFIWYNHRTYSFGWGHHIDTISYNLQDMIDKINEIKCADDKKNKTPKYHYL